MRASVLSAIKASDLKGLRINTELPFDDSGEPLYVRNSKTVYVDEAQFSTDPIIETLDGTTISNTTTTVKVYFTTDAKNIQPTYSTNVETLKGLKNTIEFAGSRARDVIVNTDYVGDQLVTEVEYRITNLT